MKYLKVYNEDGQTYEKGKILFVGLFHLFSYAFDLSFNFKLLQHLLKWNFKLLPMLLSMQRLFRSAVNIMHIMPEVVHIRKLNMPILRWQLFQLQNHQLNIKFKPIKHPVPVWNMHRGLLPVSILRSMHQMPHRSLNMHVECYTSLFRWLLRIQWCLLPMPIPLCFLFQLDQVQHLSQLLLSWF